MPPKFSDIEYETLPYRYPNVWQKEQTTGPDRVVVAPSSRQIELLLEMTRQLPEPFGLLYELLASRNTTDGDGRYQSNHPCSREELETFLLSFADYFEGDDRFNLWVFSLPEGAQIIYDNHNVVYGYGPLDAFVKVAETWGLTQGEVRYPDPHAHHYNASFDAEHDRVMNYWEWLYFPLPE